MEALAQATAGIDALAAVDPAELDPAALGELIVGLHKLSDRLSGVTHRAVAVQGRTAAWQGQGARSHKQWLAQHCRLSPGEAAGKSKTAQRLAALPETAEALAEGRIGAGHARVAAQAVRDLPPEAAAGLDQLVADEGAQVDAARLRTAVDDYAHRTAPGSLVERERRAWEHRRLNVSRTVEGAVALDGRLDVLGGETVVTALAALSAPGGAEDDRSAEQRHADALVTLARQALDQGELPTVGGVRPHVTVVVPLETLQNAALGTAEAGGNTETGSAEAAGQAELGLDAAADQTDAADAAGTGTTQGPGATPPPDAATRGGPARLDRLGVISGEAARMLACDAGVVRVIHRRRVTAVGRGPGDPGGVGCAAAGAGGPRRRLYRLSRSGGMARSASCPSLAGLGRYRPGQPGARLLRVSPGHPRPWLATRVRPRRPMAPPVPRPLESSATAGPTRPAERSPAGGRTRNGITPDEIATADDLEVLPGLLLRPGDLGVAGNSSLGRWVWPGTDLTGEDATDRGSRDHGAA